MEGLAYHVLNRANGRLRLFKKDADFAAFDTVLAEARQRIALRILGYCVMPKKSNDFCLAGCTTTAALRVGIEVFVQ